ncbi:hypothetical protein [Muribaculum intestinale]|uniref:hypothetical protein n=1 Tax=Muribaculum intestinale TaxID=1796646 RepID=UPI00242C4617|nr:hypothetical protein [Muribaculum intestinale]
MNKRLLQVLEAKCKDMGLSKDSIQQITTLASNGLGEDATDEAIEQRANEYLPVFKAMQAEATRWAQGKKPVVPPTTPPIEKPIEANVDAIVEAVTAQLKTQLDEHKTTITELTQRLAKSERGNLIAAETKKLGLTEADMEFITIPEDADVADYLGRYKQSLVDRGLKPADKNVTAEQKKQAETELAKVLLAECEVK